MVMPCATYKQNRYDCSLSSLFMLFSCKPLPVLCCLRILIHIETQWPLGLKPVCLLFVAALCLGSGNMQSQALQNTSSQLPSLTGREPSVLFELSMQIHPLQNFIGWRRSVLLMYLCSLSNINKFDLSLSAGSGSKTEFINGQSWAFQGPNYSGKPTATVS